MYAAPLMRPDLARACFCTATAALTFGSIFFAFAPADDLVAFSGWAVRVEALAAGARPSTSAAAVEPQFPISRGRDAEALPSKTTQVPGLCPGRNNTLDSFFKLPSY